MPSLHKTLFEYPSLVHLLKGLGHPLQRNQQVKANLTRAERTFVPEMVEDSILCRFPICRLVLVLKKIHRRSRF